MNKDNQLIFEGYVKHLKENTMTPKDSIRSMNDSEGGWDSGYIILSHGGNHKKYFRSGDADNFYATVGNEIDTIVNQITFEDGAVGYIGDTTIGVYHPSGDTNVIDSLLAKLETQVNNS